MQSRAVLCVIPTHARDAELAKALDSVLAQTQAPDRIVVVDDLGAPSTRQLVGSYSLPTISYLDASGMQPKSAAASRNAGAAGAKEPMIAFLDDDDRWRPDFLKACLDRLEEDDVELVAVWGDREHDGLLEHGSVAVTEGLAPKDVLTQNPGLTGSNFVIRREAFERVGGFDPELWVYNDLDFFVRLLDAGVKYSVVRLPLFVQVSNGEGHLSSRSERRAVGIDRYRAKHGARLTPAQRRRLIRDAHHARRYASQPMTRRAFHFVAMWAYSSPALLRDAVSSRLRKAPRLYQ